MQQRRLLIWPPAYPEIKRKEKKSELLETKIARSTSLAIRAYAGLRGGVGLSLVKSQCAFLCGLSGVEPKVRSVATECDVDPERNFDPSKDD